MTLKSAPHREVTAGAGEQDRADFAIVDDLGEHLAQLFMHHRVERVALLGPVEHDGEHALVVQLGADGREAVSVGHRWHSPKVGCG